MTTDNLIDDHISLPQIQPKETPFKKQAGIRITKEI